MGASRKFANRAAGAALVISVWGFGGAQAQQPTPAQTSAIRGSCRSDFMANCSGVQPGGRDALQCLERNVARLSPACKTAVSAVMPAPAKPAAAPPPAHPAQATPAPSMAPVPAEPSAAAPSEPMERPAAPRATAPKAQRVVKPAPAHQPSSAQIAVIRQSCRSDFMAHCPGVTPGGKDALLCLQRNARHLSRGCKAAVEIMMPRHAVPERSPAAAAEPVPPPARPAVAPLRVRSFILPQRRIVIVGICHVDVKRLCAGVPPGGERILKCLGENAASLTPECYAAVSRVSIR
jgi:hypothetical protein